MKLESRRIQLLMILFFFFFQAEDGIRDLTVTGVQTCALPIFNKQGALSPEEFEHVKQHVVIGSQILAPLPHLEHIIAMVRSHHERWDGTGYPDGLRGEEIPLGGRVIATAEGYDALCTSPPYQEKPTPEQNVPRMADLAGTVLDPKVFEALSAAVGRRHTPVFPDEGTSHKPESARPPASRGHCR